TGRCEEAAFGEKTGLPIGISEGELYQSYQVHLDAGDSMLLFTDGISEAMDVQNKQLQVQGICTALEGPGRSVADLGHRLVQLVKRHASGRGQHDDITLVCFGRKTSGVG